MRSTISPHDLPLQVTTGFTSSSRPRSSCLCLKDGTSWSITGNDAESRKLASSLTRAMRLGTSGRETLSYRLLIKNDIPLGARRPDLPLILDHPDTRPGESLVCRILPVENDIDLADQLTEIGLILASSAEARGGMLLHGALAERNGRSVLLAGPSEVGKSTASLRLAPPWRSLSDECTLVVRKPAGEYFAHPWPTWSTYLEGDQGQNWDVQHGFPLTAICLLVQDPSDSIKTLDNPRSICMLNESAEQAWSGLSTEFDRNNRREIRTRRFTNICALVTRVPCYLLRLSRSGSFWEQIESILEHEGRTGEWK